MAEITEPKNEAGVMKTHYEANGMVYCSGWDIDKTKVELTRDKSQVTCKRCLKLLDEGD